MKELVVIATHIARGVDGYTTRILMELERLKDYYDITLLIQGSGEITVEYDPSIKIISFPVSDIKIRGITLLLNRWIFESVFKKHVKKGNNTIVYAESLFPAMIARKIAKKNGNIFVYDCHGTQPDEYRLYHKGRISALIARLLERRELDIVKNSQLVVTVTDNQYKKWGLSCNHVVLPMTPAEFFFDTYNYRDDIRRQLGIGPEEIVFVYSGRNQKWQMAEETVEVYKKILRRIPNARLIILSPDCEAFSKIVERSGIKNVIIRSVNYREMPKYLDACDYGFCLRADSIINKVASPTKVLEYLSRNVKPILTEFVGEFSGVLEKADLAEIIDIKNSDIVIDVKSLKTFDGKNYVSKHVNDVWNNYISELGNLN